MFITRALEYSRGIGRIHTGFFVGGGEGTKLSPYRCHVLNLHRVVVGENARAINQVTS